MKTEELEAKLRDVLHERAARITESDLGGGASDGDRVVSMSRGRRDRRWQGLAVAAVVLVVVGLVAAGLFGRAERPAGERVEQMASEPQGVAAGESSLRAWPLNNDEPLPAGSRPEEINTPEATARTYLTRVVGLPPDWEIDNVETTEDTAVANYILQDVPADIRMAKSAEGFWYVTGANTDHARPGAPVVTEMDDENSDLKMGFELSLAAGPRTHPNGAPVRLTVLAANGGLIAGLTGGNKGRIPGGSEEAHVVSLQWAQTNLPAAIQVDVLDDHDANASTPEVVIGHWSAAVPPPEVNGLPAGSDLAATEPIFASGGAADEVADAYLRDRFPDHPSPGIDLEPAWYRGRMAYARWSTSDNGERIADGMIVLRHAEGDASKWSVVASTTNGVDLSEVEVADGRVRGRITTDNINSLFADVFQPDGTPAAGSPRPEGQPDAAYRFGTAGGPGRGSLDIDVPVEPGSAVVRVNLVGGTILSISEVRLTVPPPAG